MLTKAPTINFAQQATQQATKLCCQAHLLEGQELHVKEECGVRRDDLRIRSSRQSLCRFFSVQTARAECQAAASSQQAGAKREDMTGHAASRPKARTRNRK